MLLGYNDVDISFCHDSIIKKHLAEKNLFKEYGIILSNNSKDLIAQILMESDDRAVNCGLDFEDLATKLMEIYPTGIKPGKTYSWRGDVKDIAQKLRTLIVKYEFNFTEEEAIKATKEYIEAFKAPYTYMHTLQNFLLYVKRDSTGHYEMESIFMTIVESNREKSL